jgi:hypothetical protein
MEKIGERIGMLRREILMLQARYGLSYEKFHISVATDEDFVQDIRKSHSTWERDFNAWEYYSISRFIK